MPRSGSVAHTVRRSVRLRRLEGVAQTVGPPERIVKKCGVTISLSAAPFPIEVGDCSYLDQMGRSRAARSEQRAPARASN